MTMKKRAVKRLCNQWRGVLLALFLFGAMSANAEAPKIGEYVQMGTYVGEPILWRCVDIDENGALLMADKILCLKAMDAQGDNTEGSHGRGADNGSYRRQKGSNYWGDSNLRDWLNSSAAAGEVVWSCGNPPDREHVVKNAYADEAGFLNGFTNVEQAVIKTVNQKQLLDAFEYPLPEETTQYHRLRMEIDLILQNYNTAYSETQADTVFLPDVRQLYRVYENRQVLGDTYYIGEPTDACVMNSEIKTANIDGAGALTVRAGEKWFSWLRSPSAYHTNSYFTRFVHVNGNVYSTSASNDCVGVRPMLYLDTARTALPEGTGTQAAPYRVSVSREEGAPIRIMFNGSPVIFPDQAPIIVEGRTLSPVRAIFETVGAEVFWDADKQEVVAQKPSQTVILTIGSTEMKTVRAGELQTSVLDVPAQIVHDRTLIPVRAAIEAFGYRVGWEEETGSVLIENP